MSWRCPLGYHGSQGEGRALLLCLFPRIICVFLNRLFSRSHSKDPHCQHGCRFRFPLCQNLDHIFPETFDPSTPTLCADLSGLYLYQVIYQLSPSPPQ